MSLIYQPKGKAGEYAKWACNLHDGRCGHHCVYCYVKTMPFIDNESMPRLKPDVISCLEVEAHKQTPRQVFFCFRSDPYQPLEAGWRATRRAIEVLHEAGHTMCILTKSDLALRDLDLFGPEDAFGVTLTCRSDEESLEWEPYAPMPAKRIIALREFHRAGIPVWISFEPVINPADTLSLFGVGAELGHCHIKLGKINYIHRLPPELRAKVEYIDWGLFARDAVARLERLGYRRTFERGTYEAGTYYVKESLVKYLPQVEQ